MKTKGPMIKQDRDLFINLLEKLIRSAGIWNEDKFYYLTDGPKKITNAKIKIRIALLYISWVKNVLSAPWASEARDAFYNPDSRFGETVIADQWRWIKKPLLQKIADSNLSGGNKTIWFKRAPPSVLDIDIIGNAGVTAGQAEDLIDRIGWNKNTVNYILASNKFNKELKNIANLRHRKGMARNVATKAMKGHAKMYNTKIKAATKIAAARRGQLARKTAANLRATKKQQINNKVQAKQDRIYVKKFVDEVLSLKRNPTLEFKSDLFKKLMAKQPKPNLLKYVAESGNAISLKHLINSKVGLCHLDPNSTPQQVKNYLPSFRGQLVLLIRTYYDQLAAIRKKKGEKAAKKYRTKFLRRFMKELEDPCLEGTFTAFTNISVGEQYGWKGRKKLWRLWENRNGANVKGNYVEFNDSFPVFVEEVVGQGMRNYYRTFNNKQRANFHKMTKPQRKALFMSKFSPEETGYKSQNGRVWRPKFINLPNGYANKALNEAMNNYCTGPECIQSYFPPNFNSNSNSNNNN